VFSLSGGVLGVFDVTNIGKLLIVIGLLIAGIGVALLFSGKIPWIGRLPGDFLFEGKNSSFYFPLTTSILISVVLSLVMWFINRR
jgi:ribose/xylose/arabinose/galactoside ABC-type transport system permease subunit